MRSTTAFNINRPAARYPSGSVLLSKLHLSCQERLALSGSASLKAQDTLACALKELAFSGSGAEPNVPRERAVLGDLHTVEAPRRGCKQKLRSLLLLGAVCRSYPSFVLFSVIVYSPLLCSVVVPASSASSVLSWIAGCFSTKVAYGFLHCVLCSNALGHGLLAFQSVSCAGSAPVAPCGTVQGTSAAPHAALVVFSSCQMFL